MLDHSPEIHYSIWYTQARADNQTINGYVNHHRTIICSNSFVSIVFHTIVIFCETYLWQHEERKKNIKKSNCLEAVEKCNVLNGYYIVLCVLLPILRIDSFSSFANLQGKRLCYFRELNYSQEDIIYPFTAIFIYMLLFRMTLTINIVKD